MFLDNGVLVTSLKDMMTDKLAEGFKGFELCFAEKIGKEVRSENSRSVIEGSPIFHGFRYILGQFSQKSC